MSVTTRSETADSRFQLPELLALRGSDWTRALFAFGLTLAAALVLGLAFLFGLARAFDSRVTAGVSAAGVELAGLTRAEAEARLRSSLPAVDDGRATLLLEDRRTVIPYRAVGRDYDLAAMLDQAMLVGHGGSTIDRSLDQLRSLLQGSTVEPLVRYDRSAIQAYVGEATEAFIQRPVNAAVVLDPEGTGFTVNPAADGRRVDPSLALASVEQAIARTSPDDVTIELSGEAITPAVTTAEATAAATRADAMVAEPLRVTVEDKSYTVPVEALRSWMSFTRMADGGYAPRVTAKPIAASLAAFGADVGRPAKNAGFRMEGSRVVGVVPAVEGRQLDMGASAASIDQALAARAGGTATPAVELSITSAEPALTTKEARAAAPKMERLSSWTTYYPVGIKNFWGKNITIPTATINGYTLAPGERFDFWAAIGDVSRASGYGPGGAIINGRTEPTGALAGGICSCSTTLFNAAARAGLAMHDRRNHYYYISRYPVGLDATVFKSSSGTTQTMSFTNDTDGPILIRGLNAYGAVTFEIYGIDDGREVSFSRPSTSNYRNATDSIVYTSSLAPGVRRRVEVPVDGFNAVVTRWVRAADGTLLHEDTWFSRYAVITGIVEVGKAKAKPRPPADTTDGGTGDGGTGDGGTGDGGGG
jgi:vancomycin resistance protein YoaR